MSRRVEIIKQFLDAFNARDYQAMQSVCAHDTTFYDNARHKGGTSGEDFVNTWKAHGPDLLSEDKVVDVSYLEAPAQRTVITVMSFTGSHDGEEYLPGLKANGQNTAVRACHLWRFDDNDRLIGHEDFFDLLTVLIQLGHTSLDEQAQRALQPQIPAKIGAQYDVT